MQMQVWRHSGPGAGKSSLRLLQWPQRAGHALAEAGHVTATLDSVTAARLRTRAHYQSCPPSSLMTPQELLQLAPSRGNQWTVWRLGPGIGDPAKMHRSRRINGLNQ